MRLTGKTARFPVWYILGEKPDKSTKVGTAVQCLWPSGQLAHSALAPPGGPAKFCKKISPVKWRRNPGQFLVCRAAPLASERLLSLALWG